MRIQDVMTKNVLSIAPGEALSEARTMMKVAAVHHLIVQDKREIVGVLSERDTRKGGANDLVSDFMSDDVVTASPELTIRQAANLLRGRNIGCLPVLEGDRVVGIVTTTDLLELIGRGVEKPVARSTRWTLRARGARGADATSRHARRG
jgi:CBS domain-containing protein